MMKHVKRASLIEGYAFLSIFVAKVIAFDALFTSTFIWKLDKPQKTRVAGNLSDRVVSRDDRTNLWSSVIGGGKIARIFAIDRN